MRIIADFHIHSKYSRATSKDMDVEHLYQWAKWKGINLLGTGDFTHPFWFAELKEKLEPVGNGLLKFKIPTSKLKDNKDNNIYFILTTEVSSIYTQNGKVRKIHNLIFAPSFETVEKINEELSGIGNLYSDGRPILGVSAKDLAKIVFDIDENCLIVPAHAWTPWFSIFGSNSGFDSIEECFGDYSKYIYSIETGLSSDPAMNWRLSKLDKITLISNSDAHSPAKIMREANVFEIAKDKLSYETIANILKSKNISLTLSSPFGEKDKGEGVFLYTIEFFPEEGKYHWDGHRACNVHFKPSQTKNHQNICPVCKKPLTVGVLNRVEQLADRPEGFMPQNAVPYRNLIPLDEVIADALGQKVGTKTVDEEYKRLVNLAGSEFAVLVDIPDEDLFNLTQFKIAQAIIKMRKGEIEISPGYDGVYGKIKISVKENGGNATNQVSLF